MTTNIIVELYKYIAQEERETIKERQRQGIEIARAEGKYKGKQREYSLTSPNRVKRRIYKEAVQMLEQKQNGAKITKRQIARSLDIAPATLYRIEEYAQQSSRSSKED